MNLEQQTISGIRWTTGSTIVIAIFQILRISILTRFLVKTDFGLMALVLFVMGLTNLFIDMGLNAAILHKQNISRREYSSLYWLNFSFNIIIYLLILLIAQGIADFYEEQELKRLLPLMGLSLFMISLGQQFKTIRQKNLDFRFIAIVDTISVFMSLLLAAYLAINGFGVYALVFSALCNYFVSNLVYFITGIHRNGLLFHIKISEALPFLRIGIYKVGGQIINYFNRDLDILIVGKFFGSEVLGGYSLSKQLVYRPMQMVNPILNRIASPILTKFQLDKEQLGKHYLSIVNIISSINIPIYGLIILFAGPLVRILYGPGYENILLLVRILSIYMIIRSLQNPIGSLVIATGRTNLEFYWNLLTLIITPAGMIIGALFGVEWLAGSRVIVILFLFIPCWYYLIYSQIQVSIRSYLKSILLISPLRLFRKLIQET